MRIWRFEGKHGESYWDASTQEKLDASALAIITWRHKAGRYAGDVEALAKAIILRKDGEQASVFLMARSDLDSEYAQLIEAHDPMKSPKDHEIDA